jgi:hypothetical protein
MSGVRLCHFSTLPLRIHDFKWSGATIPLPDVPKPQTGIIVGTVTDVNDDTVPGATVVLEGPVQTDPRTVVTNGNRFFEFKMSSREPITMSPSALRGSPTGPHPPSSSSQANTQS